MRNANELDWGPFTYKSPIEPKLKSEYDLQEVFRQVACTIKIKKQQSPMGTATKKEEIEQMKEIKNEQVVALYFKRQLQKLQQEREDEQEVVKNRDVHQLFLKGLCEAFQSYLKENGLSQTYLSGRIDYSPETEKEIDAIQTKYDQKIKELNEKEKEVRALLSGCDRYSEEMAILNGYGIVKYDPHCDYVEMATES